MTDEIPMLLRAEEAARMLSLGRSTVFAMLAAGELPVVRIGRAVRIPRRELEDWIRSRTEGRQSEQMMLSPFDGRDTSIAASRALPRERQR